MRAAVPRLYGLALGVVLASSVLAQEAQPADAAGSVGGNGRLQPRGGILAITASGSQTVERIAVREGDLVRKGALLAVLSDERVRLLQHKAAVEKLRLAEAEAAAARATAELEVAAAEVALAQAQDAAEAVAELGERIISAREKRTRSRAVTQAEIALELAKARLAAAVQTAEAELAMAHTSVALAEAAMRQARIASPVDARVLQVLVQPGARAGPGALMTLADTSAMYVAAEFFEADLARLAPGQLARVTNAALGRALTGVVERIGRIVDPVSRLGTAWIRLDRVSPADRFIGMQVDVRVDAGRATADALRH